MRRVEKGQRKGAWPLNTVGGPAFRPLFYKGEDCLCGTIQKAKWLSPLAKESGPVWPAGQTWRERSRSIAAAQNATAEAAGLLPWRRNSLRQSFCTYRAATTKNVPQTALEAGNSAATIFSHYRALATEAEGEAWFNLLPPESPADEAQPRWRSPRASGAARTPFHAHR